MTCILNNQIKLNVFINYIFFDWWSWWGISEKVFESYDINLGWDGYFKGKIIQDVYVYKIEFKKDDEWVNVNGKVLLIK